MYPADSTPPAYGSPASMPDLDNGSSVSMRDPASGSSVINQVEHAVDRLSGLEALPVPEHVARFEAMHAALTEALSSIDKV